MGIACCKDKTTDELVEDATGELTGAAEVQVINEKEVVFCSVEESGFYVDDAGPKEAFASKISLGRSWSRLSRIEVTPEVEHRRSSVTFADNEKEEEPASPKSFAAKRKLRRNQSFAMVNSATSEDLAELMPVEVMTDLNKYKELIQLRVSAHAMKRTESDAFASPVDTATAAAYQSEGLPSDDESEEMTSKMLDQIARLVDQAYDILPAEMMLTEIEKLIGGERFANDILPSDLFARFARKLDYFYDVGIACSESQSDWMEVYNGDNGRQLITGVIDADDPCVLHYCVHCEIPASLTQVMAVANEIQLMPTWNSLVTKVPEIIGNRTAHYMVINYQMSALMGMYKVDALNEIRRFSDADGGFLVEYATSVAEDHPSYQEPLPGYKRMQTLIKNVFVACGPESTVLIQRGRIKLGTPLSKWVAKKIGGVAGSFIVGGLVTNSQQACKPGNPWEALMKEDTHGLYGRLDELVNSEASQRRNPKTKDRRAAAWDVEGFFNKRRFHRASSRQVN